MICFLALSYGVIAVCHAAQSGAFLNALGLVPNSARKAFANASGDWKPAASAISITGISVLHASANAARFMRDRLT